MDQLNVNDPFIIGELNDDDPKFLIQIIKDMLIHTRHVASTNKQLASDNKQLASANKQLSSHAIDLAERDTELLHYKVLIIYTWMVYVLLCIMN